MQAMGRSMEAVYPKDMSGLDYKDIPMLTGIKSLQNVKYVFSFSAGDPGLTHWIMVARDKYGIPVAGGTTAVSAPGFLPFVNDHMQLLGLFGGLKAAAEYEFLLGYEGSASLNMNPQSVAHVLILILIAIGNVKAWRKRKTIQQEARKNA
jgi:hypothetical protein